MDFFILPNGDLIFIISPTFLKENREEIEQLRTATDLLEMIDLLGNGWFDMTEKIGLTSADAIATDVAWGESEEPYIDEGTNVWYHADYQIRSFSSCLIEDGYVIFTAFEGNDYVCDYSFCISAFAFNVVASLNRNLKPEIKDGMFHLNGETCDSNCLVFPHLKDAPFVPFWSQVQPMVKWQEMVDRYDNDWTGIFALEYAIWGDQEHCSYLFATILDIYDKGEVRINTNGVVCINDLTILNTV